MCSTIGRDERIMRIGIYNEQMGSDIGGSESCAAVLAEALSKSHQVDIVNHSSTLTLEKLSRFTGTDLGAVGLRRIEPEHNLYSGPDSPWYTVARKSASYSLNPWRRYRNARAWHAAASGPYDLFINFAHWMPPFCHARTGVLVVLFPLHNHRYVKPAGGEAEASHSSWIPTRLRHCYHAWEWKKRVGSYQLKLAISKFTRTWAQRLWGIDCQVLYPPVDTRFGTVEKKNIILSVGRFTSWQNMKRQNETITAFGRLVKGGLLKWEYICAGGVSDWAEDVMYFEEMRRLAEECGARALGNLDRAEVKSLYEQAKIFWHAAGCGLDEQAHPELSEHFGIATVEAMAAGCVPVVVNRGAQPEIIEHGVSGFLWNTLEEMEHYTMRLIQDDQLRAKISGAAQVRAMSFSREGFLQHWLKQLTPVLIG
jgi:glycosyltransferase involved in cell wall biosynthesis